MKREDRFLRKTEFDPKMCSSPGGVPSPTHTIIQKKMFTRAPLKKWMLEQLTVDLGGDVSKTNAGYDSLELYIKAPLRRKDGTEKAFIFCY